ncbi:MAG: hypothetical protein H7221_07125 [Flavobacterium sp.]|nr:hypothetical protein [Flavobacterium sp.]
MCEKLKHNSSSDYDNLDTSIVYVEKFNEYGLKICDGGSSNILIEFCPWCGEKLPNSKREKWFDEIEKQLTTATTTDLGIWLNGKMVLDLG